MIVELLRLAHRVDEMLKNTLGRPYHVVLGIGLVAEIVHRARELIEAPTAAATVARLVVSVVFCVLLLIHQVGELSDRVEHRGTGAPL